MQLQGRTECGFLVPAYSSAAQRSMPAKLASSPYSSCFSCGYYHYCKHPISNFCSPITLPPHHQRGPSRETPMVYISKPETKSGISRKPGRRKYSAGQPRTHPVPSTFVRHVRPRMLTLRPAIAGQRSTPTSKKPNKQQLQALGECPCECGAGAGAISVFITDVRPVRRQPQCCLHQPLKRYRELWGEPGAPCCCWRFLVLQRRRAETTHASCKRRWARRLPAPLGRRRTPSHHTTPCRGWLPA